MSPASSTARWHGPTILEIKSAESCSNSSLVIEPLTSLSSMMHSSAKEAEELALSTFFTLTSSFLSLREARGWELTSIFWVALICSQKWSNKMLSKVRPPRSRSKVCDRTFICPFLNAVTQH